MVNVKIQADARRALTKLQRIGDFQQTILPQVKLTSTRIVAVLKKNTPVSESAGDPYSGQLRQGWKADLSYSVAGNKAKATFRNTDPRAPWLLKFLSKGTKPHWIVPKNAAALKIPTGRGGIGFAKYVWHPGTQGMDFGSQEIYAEIEDMKTRIIQAIRKVAA